MQLIKHVLRIVGSAGAANGVVSAEEVERHLAELAKQGYELHSTLNYGTIRDQSNQDVGYRVMYILTKDE